MDTQINSEETLEETNQIVTVSKKIYYAGFWIRFWAYLLDLIIVSSINHLLIYPVFRYFEFSTMKENMFTPIAILTALTLYIYFVLMTKFFKQTLGKMVFGLKVVDIESKPLSWSTVIFREVIGKFISKTIFFVGFIVIAFTPRNQGVHDLFSDTSVILERYSEK
ncbi:putative RDD family membrane protein YckC [Bacillus mesophilus]|uniref:RDD family protein n=1 Tax=Bacillus mesophilus TaxID=1808955 RepID=A0A6M0Q846_9BACI|nr:RDD family protein [Bacillus mesophilus]MBM7660532.1 putative RDD family membrane protein YckC [Bacillus mesophilus]NEY71919.1 RDD family protein [Bacillus mesophilus]